MPLSFIIHTHITHNYKYRIVGVELPSQLWNFWRWKCSKS